MLSRADECTILDVSLHKLPKLRHRAVSFTKEPGIFSSSFINLMIKTMVVAVCAHETYLAMPSKGLVVLVDARIHCSGIMWNRRLEVVLLLEGIGGMVDMTIPPGREEAGTKMDKKRRESIVDGR